MSIKGKDSAAEQPSVLTDEDYQEVLRPILSRYGMQRYLNGDEITLNPSDYRAIIARAVGREVTAHLARQSPAPGRSIINLKLDLMQDLMRFECVLTPDGKAEMYASETGAYVWFDHVVSTLAAPVAQEVAQPMHKDVEWLVEAANMARRNPDLATKMRQNCKAGHAVQEVEPGSAPAAADEVRDGWISVDERLPDDCEFVAIFNPENEGTPIQTAQWLARSCTFESELGWLAKEEVSHWMPLPAAPEVKTTASAATSADGGAA